MKSNKSSALKKVIRSKTNLCINQLKEGAERDSQPKGKTSAKSGEETAILDAGKILDAKIRILDTNPDIVVFLVRDRLLHQAVVEHIDFEQVKLEGSLRHIVKRSCCLLNKECFQIEACLFVCNNLTLYFSATQRADEVAAG